MSKSTTPYSAELGGRVAYARKMARLTQTELGRKVGLTRSSIANIEAGRQHLLAESVVAFSAVLQCAPNWLLTGRAAKPGLSPAAQRRVLLDYLDGVVTAAQQVRDILRPEG